MPTHHRINSRSHKDSHPLLDITQSNLFFGPFPKGDNHQSAGIVRNTVPNPQFGQEMTVETTRPFDTLGGCTLDMTLSQVLVNGIADPAVAWCDWLGNVFIERWEYVWGTEENGRWTNGEFTIPYDMLNEPRETALGNDVLRLRNRTLAQRQAAAQAPLHIRINLDKWYWAWKKANKNLRIFATNHQQKQRFQIRALDQLLEHPGVPAGPASCTISNMRITYRGHVLENKFKALLEQETFRRPPEPEFGPKAGLVVPGEDHLHYQRFTVPAGAINMNEKLLGFRGPVRYLMITAHLPTDRNPSGLNNIYTNFQRIESLKIEVNGRDIFDRTEHDEFIHEMQPRKFNGIHGFGSYAIWFCESPSQSQSGESGHYNMGAHDDIHLLGEWLTALPADLVISVYAVGIKYYKYFAQNNADRSSTYVREVTPVTSNTSNIPRGVQGSPVEKDIKPEAS